MLGPPRLLLCQSQCPTSLSSLAPGSPRLRRTLSRADVGMHAVGSDPLNERLQDLRAMARLDLLKTAAMAPLSVFGAVTHAPVAALAVLSGQRLGVNAENGDNSVEATMRIIAGFVTISILCKCRCGMHC